MKHQKSHGEDLMTQRLIHNIGVVFVSKVNFTEKGNSQLCKHFKPFENKHKSIKGYFYAHIALLSILQK